MKAYMYIYLFFSLFRFCLNYGKIKIIENPKLTAIKCYKAEYGFSFEAEVYGLEKSYFQFILNEVIDTSCFFNVEGDNLKHIECKINAVRYPLFNENDAIVLQENLEKFDKIEVENWKNYLGKKNVTIGKCFPQYDSSFTPSEKVSLRCIDNSWQLLTIKGTFNQEKQLPQQMIFLSEKEYDYYYNFSNSFILDGKGYRPLCNLTVLNSTQSGNDIIKCRINFAKPLNAIFFTTIIALTTNDELAYQSYGHMKLSINDSITLNECRSSLYFVNFNLLFIVSLFLI